MRDTSNTRPNGITVERLDGDRARVSLCTNIVERTNDEGETVFDYDRYSLETKYTDNLTDRVTASVAAWIERMSATETAEKAAEVRAIRDRLLKESDAAMTIDRALKLEIPDRITATSLLAVIKDLFEAFGSVFNGSMAAYRQALRDIPQQPGFPFSVSWPVKPEDE